MVRRTNALVFVLYALLFITSIPFAFAQQHSYLGFDRNEYPGDDNLKLLRKTFSFTGYWLNNPPGARTNSWVGKRKVLEDAGFGFLVVFNGRTYAEIKKSRNAHHLATSDAAQAVSAARREGFPARTIIFLDQEEGGRMLSEQREYIHAWADEVVAKGFRAGVYCSGIAYKEGAGETVITAVDLRRNASGRELVYWVSNDVCPPSPGCTIPKAPPSPGASGVAFAEVWQYAQSPQRRDFAASCGNYHKDKTCYAPGGEAIRLHVDIDVATSPDPSHGRSQN